MQVFTGLSRTGSVVMTIADTGFRYDDSTGETSEIDLSGGVTASTLDNTDGTCTCNGYLKGVEYTVQTLFSDGEYNL